MKATRLILAVVTAVMLAVMPAMTAFAELVDVEAVQEELIENAEVKQEETAGEEIPAEEQTEIKDEASAPQEAEDVSEIVLEATADDGMKVTLTAEEDAFAANEGLELIAEVVSDAGTAEAEIDKQVGSENVAKRVTYDIRVEKDGEELQPTEGKEVKVAFSLADVPSGADDVTIYHHDETDGLEVIATEAIMDNTEATVSVEETGIGSGIVGATEEAYEDIELINDLTVEGETDSFSLYTVDFTYDDKTVSIPGDSTRNVLADILTEVDVTDEIAGVDVYSDSEFRNKCDDGTVRDGEKELFKVYEEGGIWYVDAVNAFSSQYGVIVTTTKGTEYRVKVTDAISTVLSTDVCSKELEDAFYNAIDGRVILTSDVNVVSKGETEDLKLRNMTIKSGVYDLFLNGHQLYSGGKSIAFTDGAVLNIYGGADEDQPGDGKLYTNTAQTILDAEGGSTINIYSGTITSSGGYEFGIGNATVNMYGGTMGSWYLTGSTSIVNQYGGTSVNGNNPGTFNIIGGTIRKSLGGNKHIVSGSFLCQSGKVLNPTDYLLPGCTMTGSGSGPFTASRGTNVAVRVEADGNVTGYTSLAAALNGNGTVVMLEDRNEDITIAAGRDITLNLNGKVLEGTGTGSVITVENGAEFELFDSDYNAAHEGAYSSLPAGGVVTGGSAAQGGGINNLGALTITGGTITGNAADLGGGVYSDGTVTVSKRVKITGNTDSTLSADSNLYLKDQQMTIVNTGLISGAEIGVSVNTVPTAGNPVSITGVNVLDYSQYFFSDSAEYSIINDNNAVKLEGYGGGTSTEKKKESESWTAEPSTKGSASSPVTGGAWNGVNGGFTYTLDGEVLRNSKAWITYTAADGKQYTGCFYFDKSGRMATGWQLINGVWYYFEPTAGPTQGMMYISRTTPDGYVVDAEGKWVKTA